MFKLSLVCMMIAEHIVVNLKSKKLLIGNYFQKQKLLKKKNYEKNLK